MENVVITCQLFTTFSTRLLLSTLHELSFARVVLAGLCLVALTCSKQPGCKAWLAKEGACGMVRPHAATKRPKINQSVHDKCNGACASLTGCTCVVSGLITNVAEAVSVQTPSEHLSGSLSGVVHAGFDSALQATFLRQLG